MSELVASGLFGAGLGLLVLALWPRPPPAPAPARVPPRLELDDGTPRTLH